MELNFSKKIKDSESLNQLLSDRNDQSRLYNLSDQHFAYIEAGGQKGADEKTAPRSFRHFPMATLEDVEKSIAELKKSPLSVSLKSKISETLDEKLKKIKAA